MLLYSSIYGVYKKYKFYLPHYQFIVRHTALFVVSNLKMSEYIDGRRGKMEMISNQ